MGPRPTLKVPCRELGCIRYKFILLSLFFIFRPSANKTPRDVAFASPGSPAKQAADVGSLGLSLLSLSLSTHRWRCRWRTDARGARHGRGPPVKLSCVALEPPNKTAQRKLKCRQSSTQKKFPRPRLTRALEKIPRARKETPKVYLSLYRLGSIAPRPSRF
ncbi:hypothetical protein BX600DRAFT_175260 [Xylariales sp. PMI_506]|nr:hypothetical protein BX600DRAFT_175260 [Xylariales sp. PMI_506]